VVIDQKSAMRARTQWRQPTKHILAQDHAIGAVLLDFRAGVKSLVRRARRNLGTALQENQGLSSVMNSPRTAVLRCETGFEMYSR
jgi:hypothetical protein